MIRSLLLAALALPALAQAALLTVPELRVFKTSDLVGQDEVYLLGSYARNYPSPAWTTYEPVQVFNMSPDSLPNALVQNIALLPAESLPLGGHLLGVVQVAESDGDSFARRSGIAHDVANFLAIQTNPALYPYSDRAELSQMSPAILAEIRRRSLNHGDDDLLGLFAVEFWRDIYGEHSYLLPLDSANGGYTSPSSAALDLWGSGGRYQMTLRSF
jgi:hypothetical protein